MPRNDDPRQFVVNSAKTNYKSEMLAESIKRFEPELRSRGVAIKWDSFNTQLYSSNAQEVLNSSLDSEKYNENLNTVIDSLVATSDKNEHIQNW